jgi:hypothetical protein
MTKKQPDYNVSEFNQNLEQQEIAQIRQGIATNQLSKIIADKKNTEYDPFTGISIYRKNQDFQLSFIDTDFSKVRGYTATTAILLDILIYKLTQSGANSPVITLSLDEFMKLRGLKTKKEARKQVTSDLETLFNCRVSFTDTTTGKYQNFIDLHVLDSKGIKNSIITVTLGLSFYTLIKNYPLMLMPINVFSLNLKANPHAYYISRKLAEHKRMNLNKANENIISVKTLVDACPLLPTYDEVSQAGRQINQRIIQPFINNLTALEEYFNWEFCNQKGLPLTDEQLELSDYETFINLFIKFDWKQGTIPTLKK